MAFTDRLRSPVSVRLLLSYVLDWIILVGLGAVGGGFSLIGPNRRPFDLTDPEISFPLTEQTISDAVLFLTGLVAPAAIIFAISLFIGLGPTDGRSSKTAALQRKAWELNAGLMGLALALAVSFVISNGTKQVVGKPRPNLLARCDPDLSRFNSSTVGGIGSQLDEGIHLVSWTICRNQGSLLEEGFRSFPSGHATFSFAGLTYLSLWICAKFAITLPFLNYSSLARPSHDDGPLTQLRSEAAAPPTYLLAFPLIPVGGAIYISSSRYSDFWHHGFDVLAGAVLGIACAWLGFRWYHLPISRGGGWAWAPRSPKRAFGRGIGVVNYADEAEPSKHHKDLETGPMLPPRNPPNFSRNDNAGSFEMSNVGGSGQGNAQTWLSDSSRRPLR